jgi:hypothetical protein
LASQAQKEQQEQEETRAFLMEDENPRVLDGG